MILALMAAVAAMAQTPAKETKSMPWPEHIRTVLENTEPLKHPRGKRLPLYLWPAMDPGKLTDEQAEELVRELDRRGVGIVCRWDAAHREASLEQALPIARAQKKLGVPVGVDASGCLYSFYDGTPETAHVDAAGKSFWDTSFGGKPDMGCPFAIEHRKPAIRERIEWFADAYRKAGVEVGFCFADWEIDGPIEWNGAWESSKRCARCREHLPHLDDFAAFQKAMRDLRGDLEREVYAAPLLQRFPKCLVGNYAVYPHDGYRYWYDYFEPRGQPGPALSDHGAPYRPWAKEFERAGYTFAMPVVYTWAWTYGWYDFEPGDYRWFYNMLKVATNAAQHTPARTPIVTFVHWHTTEASRAPAAPQMTEWAYQELLWHMLLRGHATFFLWCPSEENAAEVKLLHSVWAAAQEYGEFLDKGKPISFDVPANAGTVVSGLRLGNRVLLRRTDFVETPGDVEVRVGGKAVKVPPSPGKCVVVEVK